jgi:hypothetical protein
LKELANRSKILAKVRAVVIGGKSFERLSKHAEQISVVTPYRTNTSLFLGNHCPETRKILVEASRRASSRVWDKAVLTCTEGLSFETAVEIEMLRPLSCGVAGMTWFQEAAFAKEFDACYTTGMYVSNMVAGIREQPSAFGLSEVSNQILLEEQVLIEAIKALLTEYRDRRSDPNSLEHARFE